jgi:hypothetical protein
MMMGYEMWMELNQKKEQKKKEWHPLPESFSLEPEVKGEH